MRDNIWSLGGLIQKLDILQEMWVNVYEKGFILYKSDLYEGIYGQHGRDIIAK